MLDITLVDTRCSIFQIFANTKRLILCLVVFIDFVVCFCLILVHHKTLSCDSYKEKVRRGYFEQNTKLCRDLKKEKLSSLKMLLLNLTYQEAAYIYKKWRKIYDIFKTSSLTDCNSFQASNGWLRGWK